MNIRNSAKAIIVNSDRDKVLLTKNKDEEGFFYLCPGGGQEHGETLLEALKRECIEEVGFHIQIGELLHIREYIGKNHEYSTFDYDVHQVENYFVCELKENKINQIEPINPDSHQVGIEWVLVNDLLEYRLYPKEIRKYIVKHFNKEKAPVYLGDVN
ncbi:NUDIX domain-containing protein (plasmid) [Alkalihalophilus pseudofirmus]|uniref:NUDIX domain-containing protein n=1 Tax=Alkalihalophilus pseudofirmus TaxID=79885 RepID=UPI00259B8CEC|nr:NUDIX domain-containing protein [Alkalihalophilus pseudofirmus]WEG19239.1 NUDIX domain-containing protein [Alkalihalophilus pseudofirmus]